MGHLGACAGSQSYDMLYAAEVTRLCGGEGRDGGGGAEVFGVRHGFFYEACICSGIPAANV